MKFFMLKIPWSTDPATNLSFYIFDNLSHVQITYLDNSKQKQNVVLVEGLSLATGVESQQATFIATAVES